MGRAARLKAQRKQLRQDPEYQRQLNRQAKAIINRGFSNYEREFVGRNIYAILSVLVVGFGFGKKRLEKFVSMYEQTINGLCDYFDYTVDDIMPECEKIVKATGFDLDNGFWEYGPKEVKK